MARMKRNESIRVTLVPEMKERIERLAQLLGLPPSTLAALAVGQYVSAQERSLGAAERMVDAIGVQFGGEMGEELKKQMGLFSKENISP